MIKFAASLMLSPAKYLYPNGAFRGIPGGLVSHKNITDFAALALLAAVALIPPAVADDAPVLPPGTIIKIRMIDRLSSEENEVGDTFRATLEEAIQVAGQNLYPKGSDIIGRVADLRASGRLSEPGEMRLVLATISYGRQATSLSVQPLVVKGESHTKNNAGKIGGGAALGAAIGAIAGGGKGAAVGTAAGAAAGTGAAAATGKKAARVESEAVLTFVTTASGDVSLPTIQGQATDSSAPPPSAVGSSEATASPSSPTQQPIELFSLRDRRIIRNCVSAHVDDLPADAIKRPESANGEPVVSDDDTLAGDLQRRAVPLPLGCEEQLSRLPTGLERVLYQGRVLLLDARSHIVDVFYLDENQ
jgi:outer membrane lipoprotein SlyB